MAPSLSELIRLPVAVPQGIADDLRSVVRAVEQLPAMISQLNRRLETLADDVHELRSTATTIQLHLISLGNDLTDVRGSVGAAEAGVTRLDATVAELGQRVRHIDDGLDDRIPDLTQVPGDVHRITRDMARVLELTPDPDEPGALGKVKDALLPGD